MNPFEANYLRKKAAAYAWSFVGRPYVWRGDDPMAGFDCSGLVVEALQGAGILPHKSDYSAAALYEKFRAGKVDRGYTGCLVFWHSSGNIVHVEIMVDSSYVIGASGGGSATLTVADAIESNAFVKMRPLSYRGGGYIICDPVFPSVD